MKNLTVILLVSTIMLAGCGKKEEPQTVAVQEAQQQPAAAKVEEATKSDPSGEGIASSLDATVSQVRETVMQESARLAEQTKAAATAALSSVDWANLSWNDLSKVSYDDKDKLLQWVNPQLDSLKQQLTSAALTNGKLNLSALGDGGWQGAVKKVVSALDTVRTSSPETWEMARGTLVMAWDALKTEASKVIGDESASN